MDCWVLNNAYCMMLAADGEEIAMRCHCKKPLCPEARETRISRTQIVSVVEPATYEVRERGGDRS